MCLSSQHRSELVRSGEIRIKQFSYFWLIIGAEVRIFCLFMNAAIHFWALMWVDGRRTMHATEVPEICSFLFNHMLMEIQSGFFPHCQLIVNVNQKNESIVNLWRICISIYVYMAANNKMAQSVEIEFWSVHFPIIKLIANFVFSVLYRLQSEHTECWHVSPSIAQSFRYILIFPCQTFSICAKSLLHTFTARVYCLSRLLLQHCPEPDCLISVLRAFVSHVNRVHVRRRYIRTTY